MSVSSEASEIGPEVKTQLSRGSATFAPLVAVDSVEATNKLPMPKWHHLPTLYRSEIFEAELYNNAVKPRQCYRCYMRKGLLTPES